MNYHIVRTNESIKDIATVYNLSVDEIESINAHIRSWDKLIPGTKLRLPAIPEQIRVEVDDTEPFIEDYYPKIAPDQLKLQNFKVNEAPKQPVNINQMPNVTPNMPTNVIPNVGPVPQAPETTPIGGPSVNVSPSTGSAKPTPPKPVKPMYPYYPYYYPYYPYYGYPNYYYGTRKR